MSKLIFGTAGIPRSSRSLSTIAGIERLAQLGLGCMELEFVRGVHLGEKSAVLIAGAAAASGIRLTVHAPYYINFNAREPDKVIASGSRLLQAARIGSYCGALDIAFHTAFYMGDSPAEAYNKIKKNLGETLNNLSTDGKKVLLRPEVMGKISQFGTIDEVLQLCRELPGYYPCVDFAHWHARTGKFNSYPEFISVLLQIEEVLGRPALDNMHIHVSGIQYSSKGEVKHLNFKESDFQYTDLLRALKDRNVSGVIICESPNQEDDALLLLSTYNSL